MLNQTFQPRDLLLVLILIVLEGLLSIDNALVLGLLARRLPERSQTKALTYGLVCSFVFRLVAVALAAWLLKWRFVKLLGGGYLLYVAVKHFFFTAKQSHRSRSHRGESMKFWSVVAAIELTDIAFAADSILAGIALVGPMPPGSRHEIHPKLWVILLGGMAGVLMMRIAAVGFIRLLKIFPRLESTAYLLVAIVGLKLLADWAFNGNQERINFQSPASAAFWVFWILMALCVTVGFVRPPKTSA